MSAQRLLFIYGTLRRGGRAEHRMADAEYICNGTIKGRLVHVDQYPGLIRDSENLVKGELYLVDEILMKELDQYEGCNESPPLYLSEQVDVLLDDGEGLSANTYVFQQLQDNHEEIEYGDWVEWYKPKKA